MFNKNMTHTEDCTCLSWTPVIVGALSATGFTFLLSLFSIAAGVTAFTTDNNGVESLALGGLLGTAIGIIASMFASGWLTGYLGQRHCNKQHLGALYGFLTWVLALIITVLLAMHIQQYIIHYLNYISGQSWSVLHDSSPASNMAVKAANTPGKTMIISSYIIFILFFLGAFASSLGGHCGMRYRCDDIQ